MKKLRQLFMGVLLLILISLINETATQASTAHAATRTKLLPSATAPAVYSHSWYVTNPDIPNNYQAMYNLGRSDGAYDSTNCTVSQIVLDFGQVDYSTAYWGGSSGYGTYIFNSSLGYPFITDAQVVAATENYIRGWFNGSSSCPRLRIVIGVNNYRECLSGCSTYNAGTAWGQSVKALSNYVSANGWSWQIVDVNGGDDIETDVPNGWDTYSKTFGFVQGFKNGDSTALFMDFGDAFANSYWTDAELYTVVWGYGNDNPIPEVYTSGLLNSWTQLFRNHPNIYFYGVMTSYPYGYSPSTAYNLLVSNVGSSHVGAFATNLAYQ